MMLQHEGVFMARPTDWSLSESGQSQSVAIAIEFLVVAMHNDGQWDDWTNYEEQTITGYFYIIKKDGTVNQAVVKNLAAAIGWDGSAGALLSPPPDVHCQITTRNEVYEGKTRLKVQWINHRSYSPGLSSASPEDVNKISTRFGSLLRAAASDGIAQNRALEKARASQAQQASAKQPAPPARRPVPAGAERAPAAMDRDNPPAPDDDDLPF